jgi:hypothetical protein
LVIAAAKAGRWGVEGAASAEVAKLAAKTAIADMRIIQPPNCLEEVWQGEKTLSSYDITDATQLGSEKTRPPAARAIGPRPLSIRSSQSNHSIDKGRSIGG